MSDNPINIFDQVKSIKSHWTPQHILTLNDSHSIKLATIKDDFIWHSHPNTDEVFYCVSGAFRLELEGRDTVQLKPGDVFCVPQGLQHRPVAEPEAAILIIEKVGTVNTGDKEGDERTVYVDEGKLS